MASRPVRRSGRSRAAWKLVMAAAVTTALTPACSTAPVLKGKIDGLSGIVDRAQQAGAEKCAPRELAVAQANLHFAQVDLAQGQVSKAERHVSIAEPNARAALALSPADRCQEGHAPVPKPGDRDGDGYLDSEDSCPDEPETWNEFEDGDGCPDDPDTDGDGIPDSVDSCVLESEDKDGYLDDDGCPDLDNDADGVPDTKDKCPDKPEDLDGFEDEDGCPEPDNDKDGVLDVDDFCPNTPGLPGGDRPGCPRKPSAVVITTKEIRITQQIQFETNKAVIKKESFVILDAVRDVLKSFPNITIEVQGHTDNVGNADYNLKLSQARAESVRNYLVAHGIEVSRFTAKGYGQNQPLVPNTTDANRALNRRVQFIRTEQGK